jgi:glycerate dehydrogenase
MTIVITDGFTLNPGDLNWQKFEELGEIRYYDRTPLSEISARCRDAGVIITNKTPIDERVIHEATNLKLIAVTATGYNIVDVKAAKAKNILVCNVPEYGTYSVAQHAIALLLELSNRVGQHARTVHDGEWRRSADWSYSRAPIIELKDKVLGIVGLGKIGNQTASIARALGMKVIYHRGKPVFGEATQVTLDQLFLQSDFVSLHCPLTPHNGGFVNKELLSQMKSTAYFINTSRGQLVQEQDLADALKRKVLAGAALDVLSTEPPPADHPLVGLPNCLITPHNAWLSFEARKRILDTTFENIEAGLRGAPKNTV